MDDAVAANWCFLGTLSPARPTLRGAVLVSDAGPAGVGVKVESGIDRDPGRGRGPPPPGEPVRVDDDEMGHMLLGAA